MNSERAARNAWAEQPRPLQPRQSTAAECRRRLDEHKAMQRQNNRRFVIWNLAGCILATLLTILAVAFD